MPDQPEPSPQTPEPSAQQADDKPSPEAVPVIEPRPEPIQHPLRFQGSTPPRRDTTILSEDE